jgi:hypothetical protein
MWLEHPPTKENLMYVNKTSYRFGEALHTKLLVNRLLNEKGGIKKDAYSFSTTQLAWVDSIINQWTLNQYLGAGSHVFISIFYYSVSFSLSHEFFNLNDLLRPL